MLHYNTPYMEIVEIEELEIGTVFVSNEGNPGQYFPTTQSLDLLGNDPSDGGDF